MGGYAMSQWNLRKLIVIVIGIMIILGVSGCMGKKEENSKRDPEQVKVLVLDHLQKKYGEEFVPLSFSGSSWAYVHNTMYVYPKNASQEKRVEVHIIFNKDGTYKISDNYFGALIAPEYSKVVSGFVGEIYKDFKLFIRFSDGVYPDRLNKDTKLEEIYHEDDIFVSYSTVFIKEDSASGIETLDSLRKIADRMKEKKLIGDVKIYIVRNEKFDSITLDALSAADMREYFLGDYNIVMIGKDLEILALE
jgi:hypothetical protein